MTATDSVRLAMAQENPPPDQRDVSPSGSASGGSPQGDPWHAFGYLVAGVLLYGGIGLLLDHWLGTRFLVVVGILFGAGLGIYATWSRFRIPIDEGGKPGVSGKSGPGSGPDDPSSADKQ